MNQRLSIAAATAALAALPLLAACGGGGATSGPASSTAPSQTTPSASTEPASSPTSASPSPSSSPSVDKAQDSKAAASAGEKFVTVALTIGYPDKSYAAYLGHLKPLMTSHGYAEAKRSQEAEKADKSIKATYAEKVRTTPAIKGETKVSNLTADSATTKVTYAVRIQRRADGGWETVKTESNDSVSLKLLKQGGRWLVDDAI